MEIKENIPLAGYSSWLVGGSAEYYSMPESLDDLKKLIAWAVEKRISITILSGGTNVLISDKGVPGLVIHVKKMGDFKTYEENGRLHLEAETGVPKALLLKTFLKMKLAPALFLAGLPGDVGGGVVMNAGVSEKIEPREFVEITDWIEILTLEKDPQLKRIEKAELQWSYRHCDGWQPGVIYKVGMSWPLKEDPTILNQVKDANRQRLHKQPLELPSCGSVFKNPPGAASGQLIDSCGLRGYRMGGAQVSEKHANFIVNTGKAKATEIDQLIRHIQNVVLKEKGISLTNEVVYLGLWPDRG